MDEENTPSNGSQGFLDLSLDPSKRHEKRVQNAPNQLPNRDFDRGQQRQSSKKA